VTEIPLTGSHSFRISRADIQPSGQHWNLDRTTYREEFTRSYRKQRTNPNTAKFHKNGI